MLVEHGKFVIRVSTSLLKSSFKSLGLLVGSPSPMIFHWLFLLTVSIISFPLVVHSRS